MKQARMARIACERAPCTYLRPVLLLCWYLTLALHASAQSTDRYAQGLLWKIESPGIVPSHIFGTGHLAEPRVTNIPAPVRESLNASTSFTMELTFEQANVQQLAGRMFYLDGRTLL